MTDLDTLAAQIGAVCIVRDGTYKDRGAELTLSHIHDYWTGRLWWDAPPGGYPTTLHLTYIGWSKDGPRTQFVGPAAAIDAATAFGWEAA